MRIEDVTHGAVSRTKTKLPDGSEKEELEVMSSKKGALAGLQQVRHSEAQSPSLELL